MMELSKKLGAGGSEPLGRERNNSSLGIDEFEDINKKSDLTRK